MGDRRVHAFGKGWEIVRYDRAGKWWAEWVDTTEPPKTIDYGGAHALPVRGRRRKLSVFHAACFAVQIEATIVLGVPGGGAFDREIKRLEDLT